MKTAKSPAQPATVFFKALRHDLTVLGALLLLTFQIRAETNTVAATQPGTLAYHLATNAVGHARQFSGNFGEMVEFHAPLTIEIDRFLEPAWSPTFWLKGVQGLSATSIGVEGSHSGQGLITMVSPRHYLCATHMHPASQHPDGPRTGFLGANNRLYWRKTLQRVNVGNDTSVGILDADLPPSVGFLPVLPENFTNYLSATRGSYVQGIGMNQDMCLFGEPMTFASATLVNWDSHRAVTNGLGTNWNVTLRGGDSSNPALLLIGHQLVLVSHNWIVQGGPNYARQIPAINGAMHLLSTNNRVHSDYQLTLFPLTNWPTIR